MATTTTTTAAATQSLPTRHAKRTDSAVSLSLPLSTPDQHTAQQIQSQGSYDAEWSAYLGLEDDWGYVLKDDREVKSTGRDVGRETERGEGYEEEWSAYLGLDYSGEW